MSAPNRLDVVLTHVLRREGRLELPAVGDSMFPLIRSGDVCRFIACEPDGIRKGDVILYCAENGQLIAHRVHRILSAGGVNGVDRDGRRLQFLCKGDSNAGFDRPVGSGQCIAKLLWIVRGSAATPILAARLPAVWWGDLLLRVPLISRLLRRWLNAGKGGGATLHG